MGPLGGRRGRHRPRLAGVSLASKGVSREKPDNSGGGLSIQTLLISAAAAAASATIVPLFWQRGTVIATAMTPVIVALVSEALRHPAEKIKEVTPVVTRRTATGAAMRRFEPHAAETRHPESVGARGRGPERFDPAPDAGVSADDPFGLRAAETPARRSWWKIGIATGLLAFVLGAGVVTASELTLFGGSVSGKRGETTIFGGHSSSKSNKQTEKVTPTATPSTEAKGSPTPTPTETPTVTPEATATPSATPTPLQAAPTATPTP
jgi:hypothetical protein